MLSGDPILQYTAFILLFVKLTFEMSTVHGNSVHERRDVLVKVSKFRDRKCLDPKGTPTPNPRTHAECSYHLSYRGRHFLTHILEHWPWRYR